MKLFLKIIGILVGLVALAVLSFVLFINLRGIPSFPNEARDIQVEITPERVEEGARIASMLCISCHGGEDGTLSGKELLDVKRFGDIYAPNITQHQTAGIADYTDGELIYLFRTGIKKDGQLSPPYMPKFRYMADEDIKSIVAFLRSDHRLVQASEVIQPEIKPSFLTKFLMFVAFDPLSYPEEEIVAPEPSDQIAFGKYIATAKFECYSCHSADFARMDIMVPENSAGYFGGGNKMLDLDGNMVFTPNITMDKTTGIGDWSEEEFVNCVQYGLRPNGGPAAEYPMIPWVKMTNEEASAIFAYLKSIPAIVNEVPAKGSES